MNPARNSRAYLLLFHIHRHLTEKHNVPLHIQASYTETIHYIIPFYPNLADQLQKSIPIRNRVCHFISISSKELHLIEQIAKSLQISQSTKVGM
ncbi:hypothetical protein [Bacillus sp. JCM 19041]|uniref:hypothetical protein n=1 Tax=Bacillus sp. JCM 19041 TaxID=1460637 RepID=UPI000A745989